MDPIVNPYTPNAGARPQELAGRGAELDQFRVLVGRLKRGTTEQSMIVRGLRGVGKTVLLNAFENQAESDGFLTYYHEVTPDSDLVTEIARDAQSALARLDLGTRARQKIREALAHLGTIKLAGPEGLELSVDLGSADEGVIARDLSELLVEIGRAAAEKGRGVVFLLDEVQFVREREYRAFITALHRVTQKALPVTLAAAGLPQIPQLSGEARSYAERLFSFPEIANLPTDAATAALAEPARSQGVEYEPEALRRAVEWTEGYPFYLQQLGKDAERATFVRAEIPDDRARWIDPGDEYNKLGYYRVYGTRVRYEIDGKESSFEVTSLISWRGEWYVVHLTGFK